MTTPLRRGALALALLLALPAPAAAAGDPALDALEARIRALEDELAALTAAARARADAPPPAPTPVATAPAAPAPTTPASTAPAPTTPAAPAARFTVGGFLRLDAGLTRTDGGELPDGGAARDLYLPGQVPVGAPREGTDLDLHAKWSRITLGIDETTPDGDPIAARLEFDAFGGALGSEQSTSTWGLTVRHAWASWRGWLVGQTWTNLFEPATFVDGVDIVGATDGQVFVRQAQVRYTRGAWSLSAENPETTLTPSGGGARLSSDDNRRPDLVARYTHRGERAQVYAALLWRELAFEGAGAGAIDARRDAIAASLGARVALGPRDDLRVSVTGGEAIGRYVGLGIASDAVLDADGTLRAVDGLAGTLAWRHVVSPRWRGNLYVAASRYDHGALPAAAAAGATHAARSVAANVFWTPAPRLDLGAELRLATRVREDAARGELHRLQLVARYSF